eukprot:CAMPEP_0175838918 /NCGR_PEP_ID=MMETSP0107_2-20121207/18521_1 /TAXON_ID=195067 ORGANISM="Goniomonas pacifica, Strain CCMP1869" /NCGR_SAMPLE_ID=MMETSP0107_2 /ASSEMBLY_ACC=CAM_ASM_000203 /LENGTH=544 /DNA_ID=CAMNT_0017152589 /DNA_START=6 /DNA_END=1640 /DNA_ORIENTATION=+
MELVRSSVAGDDASVLRLIHSRADPNSIDGSGCNPLFAAAFCGHYACVEVLLVAGASPDSVGPARLPDALARASRLENVDPKDMTPLIAASLNGHAVCVVKLLQAGASVERTDRRGMNAVMAASLLGNHHCAHLLLQAGANVNATNHQGATALMASAEAGDRATTHALLEAKADLALKDSSGYDVLMAAAMAGRTEIVGDLLAAGANPEALDNEGFNASGLAAIHGKKEVVQLLPSRCGLPESLSLGQALQGRRVLEKIPRFMLSLSDTLDSLGLAATHVITAAPTPGHIKRLMDVLLSMKKHLEALAVWCKGAKLQRQASEQAHLSMSPQAQLLQLCTEQSKAAKRVARLCSRRSLLRLKSSQLAKLLADVRRKIEPVMARNLGPTLSALQQIVAKTNTVKMSSRASPELPVFDVYGAGVQQDEVQAAGVWDAGQETPDSANGRSEGHHSIFCTAPSDSSLTRTSPAYLTAEDVSSSDEDDVDLNLGTSSKTSPRVTPRTTPLPSPRQNMMFPTPYQGAAPPPAGGQQPLDAAGPGHTSRVIT